MPPEHFKTQRFDFKSECSSSGSYSLPSFFMQSMDSVIPADVDIDKLEMLRMLVQSKFKNLLQTWCNDVDRMDKLSRILEAAMETHLETDIVEGDGGLFVKFVA